MEGRGGKSGKGSGENKTCKSKNMTGAARVGDCGGHLCSTVPAAPRAVPADKGGLCPPATYTHSPHGQPPAGPPHGAGPAPSRAGGRVWERAGAAEPEQQPGPGDAMSPGRRSAWRGLCGMSCAAPPGLGCPTAKPSPSEHGTAPQLRGHPVSPGWALLPRSRSSVLCFSPCSGEGMSNMAFPWCWRQRADLTGSQFPE